MGEFIAEMVFGLLEAACDWGPRWLRITCWVILALIAVAIVAILVWPRSA